MFGRNATMVWWTPRCIERQRLFKQWHHHHLVITSMNKIQRVVCMVEKNEGWEGIGQNTWFRDQVQKFYHDIKGKKWLSAIPSEKIIQSAKSWKHKAIDGKLRARFEGCSNNWRSASSNHQWHEWCKWCYRAHWTTSVCWTRVPSIRKRGWKSLVYYLKGTNFRGN